MDLDRALTDAALIGALGRETFDRGWAYARAGRVRDIWFEPPMMLLHASVDGSGRRRYAVSVDVDPDPPYAHEGVCSCPMQMDCKHVAAALVTLRQSRAGTPDADRSPEPARRAAWELELAQRLGPAAAAPTLTRVPLGLRVEARTGRGGITVQCRPVRRSPSTGKWVQSGAGWTDVLHDYRGQFAPDQARLLKRLRGTAADPTGSDYYGYQTAAWLTLDTAEESVWSVLDRLVAVGIELVGAGERDAVVLAGRRLEVLIDVAENGDGDLSVRPVLRDGDDELDQTPVVLIGDPAHGLALTHQRAGRSVLELVRLSRPVESGVTDWLAAGSAVTVPQADRGRFLQVFYPGLRRQASVVSADGSVDLPEAVAPHLRLAVHHPAAEQIRLEWAIGYGPYGAGSQFAADDVTTDLSGRDLALERGLWSDLSPALGDASPAVLDPARPDRPRARAELAGLDAAEFSSDLLEQLAAAGVEVIHSGERVDYRRADEAPQVSVSVDEGAAPSDWFDLAVTITVNGENVPFVLLFRALADGTGHLILPSGLYFALAQPEFAQLAELIGEARSLQDRERNTLRIHVQQSRLFDELSRLGLVDRQAARWQTRVTDLARRESPAELAPPAGLDADLRPYQQQGFEWLHQLWSLGLGGILADDMGLGKTLQGLALVAQVRAEAGAERSGPFLVVAPTSVVTTWMGEAARFTPGLRVVAVEQTEGKRGVALADLAAGADVVVTSYTLLRIEAEAYQTVPWAGLFLDEAQFVKNHQAKTYSCIRKLGIDFTVAMTGTPLENSLMDLWSMLSLTAPGMFPNPERFADYFQRPIERNGNAERLHRLRDRVRPVLLRRTKEQVASELPAKQEQVIEVDLHPRHARIYQRQLQRERQKVLGLIGDLDTNRFTILRSLTLLRQLSLDAALVDEEHEGVPSAKIEVLLEMVTSLVAEGHRALVFSQFTTFLKRVGARLRADGVDYAYLDGRTRNRGAVIDGFKSGTSGVFLISLKAGGFGLNLTEADYCFVLDPWWNPASEAQAVDRAHRIGQTRPVMVYRLVSKDTIEDKVMQLKARKQQLFDSVMSADGLPAGALTQDEIRSLLAG